jgi:predicted RNase H-like nuclease
MKFFEEITRHRLLNGILPLELLYSPPELDALVAAYCAWLAKNQPAQVTLIGDKQEGQILLPGIDLKNRY